MSQIILSTKDPVSIKPLIISAIHAEENELRTGIFKTRQKLLAFETKYGLPTGDFLKTPPELLPFKELEAIEWSGEYEMLRRLENELADLKKIEIC